MISPLIAECERFRAVPYQFLAGGHAATVNGKAEPLQMFVQFSFKASLPQQS
jgi:hypothetical protein